MRSENDDMMNKENYNPRRNASKTTGFQKVLKGLERKQLLHDFQMRNASQTYQPIEKIGAGAFGLVCSAMDDTNRHVAIKKIAHASATPTSSRRTLREIRVLRYIDHPNIVALLDIFRTRGNIGEDIYLVMDLLDSTLHDRIYNNGCNFMIAEVDVIRYTKQMLNGLSYLHKLNIAHRDLKPSNLLFNERENTIKIADFGMAKFMGAEEIDLKDDYSFYMTQNIATLPYRAPELLFETMFLTKAIDMWSVGCIFIEMILGDILFRCKSISSQIKMVLSLFGKPSKFMLDLIKCEKTRREAELYDDYSGSKMEELYEALMISKKREGTPKKAIKNFVESILRVDPRERYTVEQALDSPLMKEVHVPTVLGSCPFRVKNDMANIETMSASDLTYNLMKDVRSADGDSMGNAWHKGAMRQEQQRERGNFSTNYSSHYPLSNYTNPRSLRSPHRR